MHVPSVQQYTTSTTVETEIESNGHSSDDGDDDEGASGATGMGGDGGGGGFYSLRFHRV